ncbi:MAG: hypothetical protein ACFFDW_08100 [Candidatus Thorarchaeota archaeon]
MINNFVCDLKEQFKDIEINSKNIVDINHNYYRNIRFNIFLKLEDNKEIKLADGVIADWIQKFLNNAKERFVICGIGSERLCLIY